MSAISILIVVDVNGALASGSLEDNVYLIDTNGYLGSWKEGTDALNTICKDGQVITWGVVPVSPSSDVEINGFSGPMVESGVCAPSIQQGGVQQAWSGRVASRGQFASFPYVVGLSLGGAIMSLSAVVKTV